MAIDTNITLKRLIYEFNQWATAHEMINKFGYGTWLTHYAKQEENYPIFGLNCTGWNIEQWYVNYQLEVIVLGWVFDDRENQQRAESDTTQIFTDLENTIKYSDRWQSFSKLNANIVGTKVEEYGGDKAFGFLATFELKVKKKSGICDISSLLPTYDFETGTIVSPSCESATITINGSSWGTVASGGTEDIPVKDTGGTAVGSKVGSEWIVPAGGADVTTTFNGTPTAVDTPSGDNIAIAVINTTPSLLGTLTVNTANNKGITIPDITVTDSDGSTFNQAAGTNVTCTPGVSGIAYVRPMGTATTIYETYDEAWHVNNGTYDNPTLGIKPILTDYFNLNASTPNAFGTTKRFTGKTGGYQSEVDLLYYDVNDVATTEALAFPDDYVICHYSGLGYPRDFTGLNTKLVSELPIINGGAYSLGGYTGDWRIVCDAEVNNLFNFSVVYTTILNHPPFKFTINKWHTCTTNSATTYLAYTSANGSAASNANINFNSSSTLPVRTHY